MFPKPSHIQVYYLDLHCKFRVAVGRVGTLGSSRLAFRFHFAPYRSRMLGNSLLQIRVFGYKMRLPVAQIHM